MGHLARIPVQDHVIVLIAHYPESGLFLRRGTGQQTQGIIRMAGENHLIKTLHTPLG